MSWIKTNPEKTLIRFYKSQIEKRASGIRKEALLKNILFDPSASSYFEPIKEAVEKKDFELNLTKNEEIIKEFHKIWHAQEDRLILEELLKKILRLSPNFESFKQKKEVSSFIYQMY